VNFVSKGEVAGNFEGFGPLLCLVALKKVPKLHQYEGKFWWAIINALSMNVILPFGSPTLHQKPEERMMFSQKVT
jgi:hypothetical protein